MHRKALAEQKHTRGGIVPKYTDWDRVMDLSARICLIACTPSAPRLGTHTEETSTDLSAKQSRTLRAPRHRTSPQQQGQARPQARQEQGTHRTAKTPPSSQRQQTDTLQLGTFGRAKRKVDEMTKVIAEARRAGH